MSGERKSRGFWKQGKLTVSISYDDTKLTFSGHDLDGYFGGDEYEYWITVGVDDLRKALGVAERSDIGDAACTRVNEIMQVGETTWLDSHGVPYEFNSWVEWG
ncbi:MAG: hypothetical protein K0U76_17230 [Actinomycetia bacterium]|nr:hypothetical protein [Actinomycetes bacterium]